MSQINFVIPPGIFNTGTERQAAGRWYECNLVRWTNGILRPIFGWLAKTNAVSGAGRAMIAWKDNLGNSFIAVGTHSGLYIAGVSGAFVNQTIITPHTFTVGNVDATASVGYGGIVYGSGIYGEAGVTTTQPVDATVWSLDTFGQNLVGVSPDDKYIYQWTPPSLSSNLSVILTNAPQCTALVTTQERFLFALGTTDPRTVSWSDQQNATVWTPTATNQAGSFPLQTFGKLMCGRRLTGATGLWTDTDFWTANYVGGVLVYGFTKVASGCGIVSRQAAAVHNGQAVWMGQDGFWLYNGFVEALPCDVQDYVFANINTAQLSKVSAFVNSQFSEVWWFYPSGSSKENDSAVVWNYNDNTWMTHALARTCASDVTGAFIAPLMLNPVDNIVYQHETNFGYSGAMPYARTGPLEFAPVQATYTGQVPKVWQANQFIPDELLEGDVQATFYSRIYPNGPAITSGPYILSPKTDVRFTGRQVEMRVQGVRGDDWRFGNARLLVLGDGGR